MEFTNANQIHAAYMDMLNKGQHYVATLSQGPLHITDWREQQLRALAERQEKPRKPEPPG